MGQQIGYPLRASALKKRSGWQRRAEAAAQGGPLRGTWATGKNGTPEKILLQCDYDGGGGGGGRLRSGGYQNSTYCCQKGVTSLSVGETKIVST